MDRRSICCCGPSKDRQSSSLNPGKINDSVTGWLRGTHSSLLMRNNTVASLDAAHSNRQEIDPLIRLAQRNKYWHNYPKTAPSLGTRMFVPHPIKESGGKLGVERESEFPRSVSSRAEPTPLPTVSRASRPPMVHGRDVEPLQLPAVSAEAAVRAGARGLYVGQRRGHRAVTAARTRRAGHRGSGAARRRDADWSGQSALAWMERGPPHTSALILPHLGP